MHNPYYDEAAVTRDVEAGRHRAAVGGLWDTIGRLQIDFLRAQGLKPHHRLLDVGCGALRLGCKAVDFLDPGNYYGLDLSQSLIDAGYRNELTVSQQRRLPRANLVANPDFDLAFLDREVDMAIAQSVFTHLPFNHIRCCLARVAGRLRGDGIFFATAWLVPAEYPLGIAFRQPGELDGVPIMTCDTADPFHYRLADFEYMVQELPLRLQYIGEWGHPRGQPMLAFKRK